MSRTLPLLILLVACSEYKLGGSSNTLPADIEDSGPVEPPEGFEQDSTPPAEDTGDTANPANEEPPDESCNGKDDDGDGLVDEGFEEDTDGDGVLDCLDIEECDEVDNDGDGSIDEGFDEDGDGTPDCQEVTYTVEISLTADDVWQGWFDEDSFGSDSGWSTVSIYTFEEVESGEHIFAISAQDQAQVIAGFIAVVTVDGAAHTLTGGGSWLQVTNDPGTGWEDLGFDDSAWSAAIACDDTSPWGTGPSDLLGQGAAWIWHDSDCKKLGDAWFRLEFELP